MKEQFIDRTFNPEAEAMLAKINAILERYSSQGYDLSLRQLYYQFVAQNLFPADRTWRQLPGTNKWVRDPRGTPNAEPNYKWLGDIVSEGRLAGRIDWDMIKDRGREAVHAAHWTDPAEIVDACAAQFRVDRWAEQPNYVEVMVEKQALEGVLEPVCRTLDVPFTANKGYTSSSALYEASKRVLRRLDDGRAVHIIYLGDHDPSGIDMSRDIADRLQLFTSSASRLVVHRIALNMDQVEELRPPENPAKLTDSRAGGYIARFGHSSWELDAIEPNALATLVRQAVERLRDMQQWKRTMDREAVMRRQLRAFATEYRKRHD